MSPKSIRDFGLDQTFWGHAPGRLNDFFLNASDPEDNGFGGITNSSLVHSISGTKALAFELGSEDGEVIITYSDLLAPKTSHFTVNPRLGRIGTTTAVDLPSGAIFEVGGSSYVIRDDAIVNLSVGEFERGTRVDNAHLLENGEILMSGNRGFTILSLDHTHERVATDGRGFWLTEAGITYSSEVEGESRRLRPFDDAEALADRVLTPEEFTVLEPLEVNVVPTLSIGDRTFTVGSFGSIRRALLNESGNFVMLLDGGHLFSDEQFIYAHEHRRVRVTDGTVAGSFVHWFKTVIVERSHYFDDGALVTTRESQEPLNTFNDFRVGGLISSGEVVRFDLEHHTRKLEPPQILVTDDKGVYLLLDSQDAGQQVWYFDSDGLRRTDHNFDYGWFTRFAARESEVEVNSIRADYPDPSIVSI